MAPAIIVELPTIFIPQVALQPLQLANRLKTPNVGSRHKGPHMEVVEPIETMRKLCRKLRQDAKRSLRLVPTMGSLHSGHASIIKRAKEPSHGTETGVGRLTRTDPLDGQWNDANCPAERQEPIVIVSIFVNPIQFNNRQDYVKYPKTFEADLDLCRRLAVDYVFLPTCQEIYQSGKPTREMCLIGPPRDGSLANDLEASSRPGHFEGVLTVVCKLFNIIQPHEAYFGEKDYQQLLLVTKMVQDLSMDVKICRVPTVRDLDKLPLSSRNSRLSAKSRRAARIMCNILEEAKATLEDRCARYNPELNIETVLMSSILVAQCLDPDEAHDEWVRQLEVDYLELRCAQDLAVIHYDQDLEAYDCQDGCVKRCYAKEGSVGPLEARLLISVVVDGVRLIDNVEVCLNSEASSSHL